MKLLYQQTMNFATSAQRKKALRLEQCHLDKGLDNEGENTNLSEMRGWYFLLQKAE